MSNEFVQIAQKQSEYIKERLEVVEKTLGISDKAIDFRKKQIEELESIAEEQSIQLEESELARTKAERQLSEAMEEYDSVLETLQLKDQEQKILSQAMEEMGHSMQRSNIAVISHELRGSLHNIYSISSFLRHKGKSISKLDLNKKFDDINQEVQLANHILENATFVSTLGQGSSMPMETIDIHSEVEKLIKLYEARFTKERLQIRTNWQDLGQPLIAKGNRQAFRIVFNNLLENAIKYALKDTFVEIAGYVKEGGLINISVSNLGGGIEKDELPYIFEANYRGRRAHMVSAAGLGLGLNISKRLVSEMKGKITIQSRPTRVNRDTSQHIVTLTVTLQQNGQPGVSAEQKRPVL